MSGNHDTTGLPVAYRYYEEPHVVTLRPPNGPVGGGTYVEVGGVQFDRASAQLGEMACRFNTTTVAATFVTSTLLQCVAPSAADGYARYLLALRFRVPCHSPGPTCCFDAVIQQALTFVWPDTLT